MRIVLAILLALITDFSLAQNATLDNVLRFDEYLAYVKKFHPIVKQARLVIDLSEANLLSARGAFDPKIEVDYSRKEFKGTEYWDELNGIFKVPTWFGIELKGTFENNTGAFLNPRDVIPDDGLYSAGLSIPVGKGLFINDRMAALKQAKLFKEQAKADRDILVNKILYQASLAYFNWLQAYNEFKLFENFLSNAEFRLKGIEKGRDLGENAEIEVVEARIAANSRRLSLEQAKVSLTNTKLLLATYLWLENNIPVDLQSNVIPDVNSEPVIDAALNINELRNNTINIDEHPKLVSLNYKLQSLDVERRLKANSLLPRIDLEYNFLTQTPDVGNNFNTAEYKGGISFSYPLFLRKERGNLRLAKIKLRDTQFERDASRVTIINKIDALKQELQSYVNQNEITNTMVNDLQELLKAEEQKFRLGESSLFLVNSRESKLIEGKLKAINIQNKFFKTKAKLFNSLTENPDL